MDKQNDVFLIQTDTTVGFLSKNEDSLSKIKGRTKKTLEVLPDLKTLKDTTRVPSRFKNFVRRSKKTTFIYPNKKAYRVVDKNAEHNRFLKKFGVFYSTSANFTGKSFELDFAYENCDVIVESKEGFSETTPSKIFRLNSSNIRRIR